MSQTSTEITEPAYVWRQDTGLVSYGLPFNELAKKHVARLGASRILLIVSGTLARTTKEVEKLETSLSGLVVAKKVGMKPHSDGQEILDVMDQARKCNADMLLTLGGGSITDAAKFIALALANPSVQSSDLDSLVAITTEDVQKNGEPRQPAALPLVCIPTTLSAGEYVGGGGWTDSRDHKKLILIHESMTPKAVILDPVLARLSPEDVWIPSGIRSIDHCIELLCRVIEPDADVDESAKKGLALLAGGLLKLKRDPGDDEARLATMLGARFSMDGVAKLIRVGGSHAIGHALGALGVPHGYTSCIMSPAVMRYNKSVNADKQEKCVTILWENRFVASALEARGLNPSTCDLADCLDMLFRDLGVPRTLREVGFEGDEKIKAVAANTLTDHFAPSNPRPLVDAAEVEKILRMAL